MDFDEKFFFLCIREYFSGSGSWIQNPELRIRFPINYGSVSRLDIFYGVATDRKSNKYLNIQ